MIDSTVETTAHKSFAYKVEIAKSCPPQLRRAEPRRAEARVVLVNKIISFDQHHPGASCHPSSSEEGSFLRRSA
jgi:hypothetical protein